MGQRRNIPSMKPSGPWAERLEIRSCGNGPGEAITSATIAVAPG